MEIPGLSLAAMFVSGLRNSGCAVKEPRGLGAASSALSSGVSSASTRLDCDKRSIARFP